MVFLVSFFWISVTDTFINYDLKNNNLLCCINLIPFFNSLLSPRCILFPSNLHTVISSQNLSCFLSPYMRAPPGLWGPPQPQCASTASTLIALGCPVRLWVLMKHFSSFPSPPPRQLWSFPFLQPGRAPCFLPVAPLVFHSTLSVLCSHSTWHLHVSCPNKNSPTDMRKWLAFLSYYRVSSPAVILEGSAQRAFTELRS